MRVLKFGGTSVAGATAISRTLDIICNQAAEDRLVVISSAISGCTDALLSLSGLGKEERAEGICALREKHNKIVGRLFTGAEKEMVCSQLNTHFEDLAEAPAEDYQTFGELFSTTIIARKLSCEGFNTLWLDSRSLIKVVDGVVDTEYSYKKILQAVEQHPQTRVFVAPGFIASDATGHVTTLGRGGSDYSAALFAAALDCSDLQIWTDVPGVMTANPKEVRTARTVGAMSFDAAFTLADNGAKVLYPPSVKPAAEKKMDMRVLNTFSDHPFDECTLVCAQRCMDWVGVTSKDNTITLVRDGEIDQEATTSRILSTLKREGITPDNIVCTNSYAKITLDPGVRRIALNFLHDEFFVRHTEDTTCIYLAGCGAVGSALLKLIEKNSEKILQSSGKRIVVKAISHNEQEDQAFFEELLTKAKRHSIFVDATDSQTIWNYYLPLLDAGIDIVSSNRRSLSVPYATFSAMKAAALRSGCFLRYETCVGAALPMLGSLRKCAKSSDEIISIEAALSCTLNKVLTSSEPFDQALQKARAEGLTEKDPSADLAGKDALKKLLILAREAGIPLEEEHVKVGVVTGKEELLPCTRYVAALYKDPSAKLGYRASIELQNVPESHPAYSIRGTENVIIVRSELHPTPLIIRGAGEGAKQAASSILNDILR